MSRILVSDASLSYSVLNSCVVNNVSSELCVSHSDAQFYSTLSR
jgi:hypothetical protein